MPSSVRGAESLADAYCIHTSLGLSLGLRLYILRKVLTVSSERVSRCLSDYRESLMRLKIPQGQLLRIFGI